MTDDLLAILDAALAEPVRSIHVRIRGCTLELTYDGLGIVSATWCCGSAWWPAEAGEA